MRFIIFRLWFSSNFNHLFDFMFKIMVNQFQRMPISYNFFNQLNKIFSSDTILILYRHCSTIWEIKKGNKVILKVIVIVLFLFCLPLKWRNHLYFLPHTNCSHQLSFETSREKEGHYITSHLGEAPLHTTSNSPCPTLAGFLIL